MRRTIASLARFILGVLILATAGAFTVAFLRMLPLPEALALAYFIIGAVLLLVAFALGSEAGRYAAYRSSLTFVSSHYLRTITQERLRSVEPQVDKGLLRRKSLQDMVFALLLGLAFIGLGLLSKVFTWAPFAVIAALTVLVLINRFGTHPSLPSH